MTEVAGNHEKAQKNQRALVIGGSGMAGKALMRVLKQREYTVKGVSRSGGGGVRLNAVTESMRLFRYITDYKPNLIINCAAMVSLRDCEKYANMAHKVNAELPGKLADYSGEVGAKFIQISTDHYYTGDINKLHTEEDKITIVNKYAETKRGGETSAMKNCDSLVIRTNITGFRGQIHRPTFAEWLIETIKNKKPLKLYTDFYTSTIDAEAFSNICINQKTLRSTGILNIAASKSVSKKEFALTLAKKMGINLDWYEDAYIMDTGEKRAESLGLDCTKIETITGKSMPKINEVTERLLKSYNLK